ncbi:hypothetical protein L861_08455 [Litchfieldella anticariensis FP35 = DSM 16096]|uniref:Uncharacterized protein n=1 Tax=Litchfieldella anticariensis (strain DSM 16096 / CECT 5854 / CIP 108499 / LMG 22089 / FP35) TaxID=1121939 RepID=S2KX27_LITA3|nr:hypothetical protein [Halomonas anticariensis]EPB99983.1 hypothetical protein L861_08455 [Halomonas anticariensis FP35 = DSM 16096]
MAKPTFDVLRALAIASQALGFITIITLETLMGDAARFWQGWTLALMVIAALWIALVRLYRRNKARKTWVARQRAAREEEDEA